jgi:outer membrane immunogenic protein
MIPRERNAVCGRITTKQTQYCAILLLNVGPARCAISNVGHALCTNWGHIVRRQILISAIAFGALIAPAMSADLAAYKAPPVPVCFWCGWYVGGNVGGTWMEDTNVQTGSTPVSSAATFAPEAIVAASLASNSLGSNKAGFIGGGQIGYNWQYGNLLYGLETDIQGLSNGNNGSAITVNSGVPGFPTEAFTSTTAVSKSVNYLGTFRGRLGFLLSPSTIIYGTGGLAYGGVHAATSITQSDSGILPGPVTAAYSTAGSISQTRAGWTLGGGVEMQLWGTRWTGKAEYLYYDLGSVGYFMPNLVANAPGFPASTWVASAASSARFTGNIARVGLNYKF